MPPVADSGAGEVGYLFRYLFPTRETRALTCPAAGVLLDSARRFERTSWSWQVGRRGSLGQWVRAAVYVRRRAWEFVSCFLSIDWWCWWASGLVMGHWGKWWLASLLAILMVMLSDLAVFRTLWSCHRMVTGLESNNYFDTILRDVSSSKTSVNDRQTYSFPKIWARTKMRWGCHWLGLLPPKPACFGLRPGRQWEGAGPLSQGIIVWGRDWVLSGPASAQRPLRLSNEQAACVAEQVCRRNGA